jgi:uncharacterized protein YigE (DUF2233 family)
VELEDSETGDRATVELALFSTKTFKLRLIDNPTGAASLAEATPQSNCLTGVNGGYFDPNFAPLGLRIIDGKTISPLVHARLLTGVLISSPGSTQILRVGEYSKSRRNPYSAVQCGPLLVDVGRRVAGLDRMRVARRTFAVVGTADRAALGFCSEISLAEIAQILASTSLGGNFKAQRALNLDGGSSSAFWFKRNGGAFSIPEEKPVRDFVALVAR